MTYILLNLLFMIIIATGLVLYARPKPNKLFWYTLLILLVMTAIFDSIIIMAGIVAYTPENILGIVIWKAPIEDFSYTIASVAIVTVLWEYFESEGATKHVA